MSNEFSVDYYTFDGTNAQANELLHAIKAIAPAVRAKHQSWTYISRHLACVTGDDGQLDLPSSGVTVPTQCIDDVRQTVSVLVDNWVHLEPVLGLSPWHLSMFTTIDKLLALFQPADPTHFKVKFQVTYAYELVIQAPSRDCIHDAIDSSFDLFDRSSRDADGYITGVSISNVTIDDLPARPQPFHALVVHDSNDDTYRMCFV